MSVTSHVVIQDGNVRLVHRTGTVPSLLELGKTESLDSLVIEARQLDAMDQPRWVEFRPENYFVGAERVIRALMLVARLCDCQEKE